MAINSFANDADPATIANHESALSQLECTSDTCHVIDSADTPLTTYTAEALQVRVDHAICRMMSDTFGYGDGTDLRRPVP